MPRRRVSLPVLACLLALGGASTARAETGFLDRLFGANPGAAPANPFASNYPSAPPTHAEARAARDARAIRRARGDEGPVPPGRIPGE